jgi:hypothetical protein
VPGCVVEAFTVADEVEDWWHCYLIFVC